jgi:phage shock protein A
VNDFSERFIKQEAREQQSLEDRRRIETQVESHSASLTRLERQAIPTETELADARARRESACQRV